MKMSCIKFLHKVVSSLHMHHFGGCSLRYVKVHLRFAASSCTHTELFQQALLTSDERYGSGKPGLDRC